MYCDFLLYGPVLPEQLSGSRVPELRDGSLFDDAANYPKYVRPQPLMMVRKESEGALWSCVKVVNTGFGSQLPFPIVAKINSPTIYDNLDGDILERFRECGITLPKPHNGNDRVRRAIRKDYIILDALRDLQGTVVPRSAGLYGGIANGQEVWLFLLEDVGPAVDEDEPKKFKKADQ